MGQISQGEWGLAKTFWIAWVLGNFGISILLLIFAVLFTGFAILTASADATSVAGSGIFTLLLWSILGILALAYYIASCIWTWRAASKQAGSAGIVAKVVIGLWSALLILSGFSGLLF